MYTSPCQETKLHPQTFTSNFEVNGLDWQCCLAGSSKIAPRIFIFLKLSWVPNIRFYVKFIAIYAPTFLWYNNSVLAIVSNQIGKHHMIDYISVAIPIGILEDFWCRLLFRSTNHKLQLFYRWHQNSLRSTFGRIPVGEADDFTSCSFSKSRLCHVNYKVSKQWLDDMNYQHIYSL